MTDDAEDKLPSLPGFDTLQDFFKHGYKTVMEGIRASNNLPTGSKFDMYTSYPDFHHLMKCQGGKVLDLINLLLRHQGISGNIHHRDLEDKFELVVEGNDAILERVGENLDEWNGVRRNNEPAIEGTQAGPVRVSGSWNKNLKTSAVWKERQSNDATQTVRLLTSKVTERPQLKFKDKIDNSSSPWEPKIKEKPNAIKPLAILYEETEFGGCYSHPYEFELEAFNPDDSLISRVTPKKPPPLEKTPFVFVDNEDKLNIMAKYLNSQKEIAIDLEHHNYRSFQGFTCLMQISTRTQDYVIDAIELRDKLHILNESFTNPKIVKVLHGASSDIIWLQRDLGLYIVNMFDTHQAAMLLNFSQLNLAFLLKHYCQVDANKHFQMYDWRIRPLSEEAVKYAREDTHFLLYIYDMMRNALIEAANGQTNLLKSVYSRSTELCKRRYVKSVLTEDGHMDMYRRSKKLFNNKQMYALEQIYRWRDKTARELDESIGYVLPNHMLLHICESLPREMQGILACCNPVPPLVRQNLLELHQIVLKAREQPLIKPIISEETAETHQNRQELALKMESKVNCVHDLVCMKDFRPDLPTLIGKHTEPTSIQDSHQEAVSCVKTPQLSVFCGSDMDTSEDGEEDEEENLASVAAKSIKFASPYQRYKSTKPYLFALEEERKKKEEEKKLAESKRIKTEEESSARMELVEEQISEKLNSIRDQVMNTTSRKRDHSPEEHLSALSSLNDQVGKKKRKAEPLNIRSDERVTSNHNVGLFIKEEKNDISKEAQVSSNPNAAGQSRKKKEKSQQGNSRPSTISVDYSSINYNEFHSNPAQKSAFLKQIDAKFQSQKKKKGGKFKKSGKGSGKKGGAFKI
nr:PREDICTED: exosome component 10 [Bemisia tabaci]